MIPASGSLAPRSATNKPRHAVRTLVIVPAKDEAASLPDVLRRLRPFHSPADTLVVDDGSADDTANLARSAGCQVVQHPFNLGYGAALLTGYHYAADYGFTHVIQMDADGQHPAEAIPSLLQPVLDDQADLVLGSRYRADNANEHGGLRRIAAHPIAWIASLWMGQRITDPTSGFQALSPAALAMLCSDGFPEDYPDVDVLIGLHRAGLRVEEVPVAMRQRLGGTSMHGGVHALYYFYRLAMCLLLLPLRRSSPYRSQRRANKRARA